MTKKKEVEKIEYFYDYFQPILKKPLYFHVFRNTSSDYFINPYYTDETGTGVFFVTVNKDNKTTIITLKKFLVKLIAMQLFVDHNIHDYYDREVTGAFQFFGLELSVYDCLIIIKFFEHMKRRMVSNYNQYIDQFVDDEDEYAVVPYAKSFEEFIEPDGGLTNTVIFTKEEEESGSNSQNDKIVVLSNKNFNSEV